MIEQEQGGRSVPLFDVEDHFHHTNYHLVQLCLTFLSFQCSAEVALVEVVLALDGGFAWV